MLQRVALYATLGWVLDLSGFNWETWNFWCIVALFMADAWLTRRETIEDIQEEVERIRKERGGKND